MLAFAYVDGLIQESVLTRQPLMYFPINYVGRPYTAGISGYKYNSWLESKKENLSRRARVTICLVGEIDSAIFIAFVPWLLE